MRFEGRGRCLGSTKTLKTCVTAGNAVGVGEVRVRRVDSQMIGGRWLLGGRTVGFVLLGEEGGG